MASTVRFKVSWGVIRTRDGSTGLNRSYCLRAAEGNQDVAKHCNGVTVLWKYDIVLRADIPMMNGGCEHFARYLLRPFYANEW